MAEFHNPRTALHFDALYGEAESEQAAEFIHIEDIRTRSRLHDWQIQPHSHRGLFQVLYVGEGRTEVRLDNLTETIEAPCVLTIPSGVIHAFAFTPETVGSVLTIADASLLDPRYQASAQWLAPLMAAPLVTDLRYGAEQADHIAQAMALIKAEFDQPQLGRHAMFEWLSRMLLLSIRRQQRSTQAPAVIRGYSQQTFAKFCRLLEQHYLQHYLQHWTIGKYADALGLSQARLNRLCQSYRKKTALGLIQDRLILEAQRLLTYTPATASMVSYELGFRDPAYFSRFFKRRVGMAPGQYQASVAAELAAQVA